MWTKLSEKSEVDKISVDNILLCHQSDEQNPIENLTGKEINSDIYKVVLATFKELTLEYLASEANLENIIVASMKKQVTRNDLLNGKWWIKILDNKTE